MKKVYIGIGVHKEQNTIALVFSETGELQIHGKCTADLERFLKEKEKSSKREKGDPLFK